ncbi:MAG: hypothetical protein ACOCU7_06705, partial [Tangfeifania sp.]
TQLLLWILYAFSGINSTKKEENQKPEKSCDHSILQFFRQLKGPHGLIGKFVAYYSNCKK